MKAISTSTLLSKVYRTYEFDGVYHDVFGSPERGGIWLAYGNEKNGKTLLALLLAKLMRNYDNVLYVSAEEGTGKDFQRNVKQAKIPHDAKNIKYVEYTPLEELEMKLKSRQGPRFIIIDNVTVYNDELKNGVLRKLMVAYPNHTLLLLAHEDKKEPYTATAKLAKKLAKIIMRVEGMEVTVSGRCPGGSIILNEELAMIYHGTQILNESNHESKSSKSKTQPQR